MTITPASLWPLLRNLGSLAAIVIGAANVGSLPASVRTGLLVVGGGLQWVEHYVANPTTGTTPPPGPTPPA